MASEGIADGKVEGEGVLEFGNVVVRRLSCVVRGVNADAKVEAKNKEIEVVAQSETCAESQGLEEAIVFERATDVIAVLTHKPHVTGIDEEGTLECIDEGETVFCVEFKFYITRLIYQTPAIEYIMIPKEKIDFFNINDTVDEASKKIAKSRHRSYPVLDNEGKVVGAISRYHLFNYEHKEFILVDHNEKKQAIDDIDEGIVTEIVDHHRFGGFESDNPISITTMAVGATATIISNKFFSQNVPLEPKLAGILLGAIVSDTMNFRSPTTTPIDIETAKKLEAICGVTGEELSKGMIDHSESLLNKRHIEIVYNDFKEVTIDDNKVGLSQAVCKSKEEYDALKVDLSRYMEDACKSGGYDLMAIMLTNPNGSGSYVLSAGSRKNVVKDAFAIKKDGFVEGLVSRKKQLLPGLIAALGVK